MYVSIRVSSPSHCYCLSFTDSYCIQRIFSFCPWELPLCLPVRASPAMYPLSVPQWELPTWRANQQMVPCWNTFPLPFILLSYCNNLESLPLSLKTYSALRPTACRCKFPVQTRCNISCEERVFRVWDLHELNKWIGKQGNCFVYTYFPWYILNA